MSGKGTQNTSRKRTFRLQVEASSDNLDVIRNFVVRIAREMGFSDEQVYDIEVAVDEAASNVIKHAYSHRNSGKRPLDIKVKKNKKFIEITITDKGKGFNPDEVKEPQIEEYLKKMKRGGLGLYLIKQLMDDVAFRIKPGVRNEIIMKKFVEKPL